MNIAISAADLCSQRIDGTRIYIKNVLNHLGEAEGAEDSFIIYLRGGINPKLDFQRLPNYSVRKTAPTRFWTQLKLPSELRSDRPDLLWMPLQTIPYNMPRGIKVVATIHDVAFRFFKKHFPLRDYVLLSMFTENAVKNADRIIAVSENTKRDLIKEYGISKEKITVVHHGYDSSLFNLERAQDLASISQVKKKYKIEYEYILYAGAIQPRKNLSTLIKAFGILKQKSEFKNLKLVIAGSNAWCHEAVYKEAQSAPFSKDILFTGTYETEELPWLLGGAEVFVFPSLYEGFGIPLLEAMASGTAVICADNSSLPEVGGDAPAYFMAEDYDALASTIERVIGDDGLREKMVERGIKRAGDFSWEKCASETLAAMKYQT